MHPSITKVSLPTFFALTLALVLTGLAYLPGLHGGFLFDDYANLPALGDTGPVNDPATFWRYITSGTADPTGRPMALLSFLLDAHDWPATALPFKRTNLLLHLLNGVLLFCLLRNLAAAIAPSKGPDTRSRANIAAVLGAAYWLLHPLFVSTTLYIVQREAMLPVLFTLAGLLLWLHGRRAFWEGSTFSGLLWITLGMGGCTAMAVLSKANGILLPALALVIEFTYLRPLAPRDERPQAYQWVMTVIAGGPSLLVVAYLLYRGWHGLVYGVGANRSWTLGERLLTEPRILVDYLELLWLPRPFTPGLFNDHISVSTSLWSPPGTFLSLLAIAALISAAILVRKRLPAVALAIVFFFIGHSIESSTVPLELYFEHRNYLPALLMFWPLALWICDMPQAIGTVAKPLSPKSMRPGTRRKLKTGLAIVMLAGAAGMTHARATLWGNTHDQALVWARLNPGSPRAQANAAQVEVNAGHAAAAIARLDFALASAPHEVQLSLNLVGAECKTGHIRDTTLAAAKYSLRTTRNPGSLLEHWFERALAQSAHPPCPELNLATVGNLLAAASSNPKLMSQAGRRQDIDHLQGRMVLLQDRPDQALADFNHALDQQVSPSTALKQAALLGAAGYPTHALAHLARYHSIRDHEKRPRAGMPRVHAWVLEQQHYWDRELASLRTTLLEDERAKGQSSE